MKINAKELEKTNSKVGKIKQLKANCEFGKIPRQINKNEKYT